jgi:excisionase family DNA binding protein
MRRGELFELTKLRTPLSPSQKDAVLRRIVIAARLGVQYTYTIEEACGILAVSRDVMDNLIHFYRLDALVIGTIYRIPWYSLAEFILDPGDDLEGALDELIQSRYRPA